MPTWFVASQDPGTSSFLDAAMVAVNFWVRTSAEGQGVEERSSGQHAAWDARTPTMETRFARQLHQFANVISIGDVVITFDPQKGTSFSSEGSSATIGSRSRRQSPGHPPSETCNGSVAHPVMPCRPRRVDQGHTRDDGPPDLQRLRHTIEVSGGHGFRLARVTSVE